eukprot:1957865-Rhodomonas_salina.5
MLQLNAKYVCDPQLSCASEPGSNPSSFTPIIIRHPRPNAPEPRPFHAQPRTASGSPRTRLHAALAVTCYIRCFDVSFRTPNLTSALTGGVGAESRRVHPRRDMRARSVDALAAPVPWNHPHACQKLGASQSDRRQTTEHTGRNGGRWAPMMLSMLDLRSPCCPGKDPPISMSSDFALASTLGRTWPRYARCQHTTT